MSKSKDASKNLVQVHEEIRAEKLVMKDNALVMASYSLTVEEQRLILACIEKAQRKKQPMLSDAIEITLSVLEYSELYGVKMVTAYKALSSSSDKLYERSIKIEEEGVARKVRWLQEQSTYDSGKVSLKFSDTISKHIREIVTEQTTYKLTQATQLRSQHSIRLFEILNMVLDPDTKQGAWRVSIDKLKSLFEIGDSYNRWVDLKKKVIEPSVKQINDHTTLKVDWEITDKVGRTFTEIQFTVFEQEQLPLGL